MKNSSRGFTLIELLVVIAIIGILSSVVLSSLGTTRGKGNDGAIKQTLSSVRNQAELYYYGNSNSYTGVCTSGTAGGIYTMVLAAAKNAGLSSVNAVVATPGAWNLATCHASATAWAAEVPLSTSKVGPTLTPNSLAVMWCVDSTGKSKQQSTGVVLAANAVTCQ